MDLSSRKTWQDWPPPDLPMSGATICYLALREMYTKDIPIQLILMLIDRILDLGEYKTCVLWGWANPAWPFMNRSLSRELA